MTFARLTRIGLALSLAAMVAACDGISTDVDPNNLPPEHDPRLDKYGNKRDTIWDLFTNVDDANTTLEVNRYIWVAALDVLNFLPVQMLP